MVSKNLKLKNNFNTCPKTILAYGFENITDLITVSSAVYIGPKESKINAECPENFKKIDIANEGSKCGMYEFIIETY